MHLLLILCLYANNRFVSFEEFKKMNAFNNPVELPSDLKDRYNYASSQCAASVLKVNKEAKGSSRILNDNKDSYMLNPCSVKDQFIILELCEDILIDTLVVGNFEYFSSTFKQLRISVAQRYPPTQGWVVLSEFMAKNTKRKQIFQISNPIIWARFVKIDFVSHYDNQYYCPLSLLQVYGTSMIEEYKKFVDDSVYIPPLALPSSPNNSAEPYPVTFEEDYFLLDDPLSSNLTEDYAIYAEEWLNYCVAHDFYFEFSQKCFTSNDAYRSNDVTWDLLHSKLPQSVYTSIISGMANLEKNHIKLIKQVHNNNLKISEKFRKIDQKLVAIEKMNLMLNLTLYDELAKIRISLDLFEKRQKKNYQNLETDIKAQLNDLTYKLERIFEETLENRKWDRFRSFLFLLLFLVVVAHKSNIYKYATSVLFYHSPSASPTKSNSAMSLPGSPLLRKRKSE
eukprot:NODE_60_length_27201_cov_1.043318.p7 type:complete len:452 gc:universal NODE_60_length_27201_cov_1.043318:21487-22842(+)